MGHGREGLLSEDCVSRVEESPGVARKGAVRSRAAVGRLAGQRVGAREPGWVTRSYEVKVKVKVICPKWGRLGEHVSSEESGYMLK